MFRLLRLSSLRHSSRLTLSLGLASGGSLLALSLSPFLAHSSHIHADAPPTFKSPPLYRQDSDGRDDDLDLRNAPLASLFRSYAVYTMCSIPALVDNSPKLLQLASFPVVRWFAEAFVRLTFFDHFVGGDTAQETVPLLHKLRRENKGALFAYSVEVDQAAATSSSSATTIRLNAAAPHKRVVEEIIRCVDVAANFEDHVALAGEKKGMMGRKTWIAIKLSALLPNADSLLKLSSHIVRTQTQRENAVNVPFPGCPQHTDLDVLCTTIPPQSISNEHDFTLTEKDRTELKELHEDLRSICVRAREKGVRVVVDAEYSWYQPAIDALTLALTKEFNKILPISESEKVMVQPLVYGTYQAYLRRTPAQLAQSLHDARQGGYALGIKLVRGAYHPYELAAHAARHTRKGKGRVCLSEEDDPPVWREKRETDVCYDGCVKVLVEDVKEDVDAQRGVGVGVLFGTHNWRSCEEVLGGLEKAGLAMPVEGEEVLLVGEDVAERVAISQLYGMSDDLTGWLARRVKSQSPVVIKYVPYGALGDVMPYLSRRAIENRSVLGDGIAAKERRRVGREMRKRLVRFAGVS